MDSYNHLADDHYINLSLSTELDLPRNRDTLLHFFEQLRKHYPQMRNFYTRDRGDHVLEEDKDGGNYRWASIEQKRINSGCVNPVSIEAAVGQHEKVLESVPYSLSVSPLDCETLNYTVGFDFGFRGNHHELLAGAIGVQPAFDPFTSLPDTKIVSNESAIQIALSDDCRTQCRVSFDAKTSAYQIRTGEFTEEPVSVYLTLRRYGSLESGASFVNELRRLREYSERFIVEHLDPEILAPLRQAIACY